MRLENRINEAISSGLPEMIKIPWTVDHPEDIEIFWKHLTDTASRFKHIEILEWGCGGSTIWYPRWLTEAGISHRWTAIEHSQRFVDMVLPYIGDSVKLVFKQLRHKLFNRCYNGMTMNEKTSVISYTTPPENIKYHFIYIDGFFRTRCIKSALGAVHQEGRVYMDNAEKDYYREPLSAFDGTFLKKHLWTGTLKQ